MLSRRNIRVKVMQTLYLLDSQSGENKVAEGEAKLLGKFELSRKLFAYLIHFLAEVARYAEKEAARKAGKYLPSEGDLSINIKIAGNTVLWQIIEDPSYQAVLKEFSLPSLADEGMIRKIFDQLKETQEYKDYIDFQERNKKSERSILEFIFNGLMLPDESFTGQMEELFMNWEDDAEMMQGLVANYLSKPQAGSFQSIISDEKRDFGVSLLRTVLEKKDVNMELIKPKLKNWDADRIATLDLILLQMGISEFLFFETIPTKVTINEYIDLAKEYSTPQSGQFVNGLLDNINKELTTAGKITKKVYKNSTL